MSEPYTRINNSAGYSWHSRYTSMRTNKQFGTSSTTTTPSNGIYGAVDSVVGSKNPKYRDQIRRGDNATTERTATKHWRKVTWFHAKSQWQNKKSFDFFENEGMDEASGSFPYPSPWNSFSPNAVIVTDVSNRCIRKFRKEYNDLVEGFLAGQDIAEYKQTLHSFRRPADALRKHTLDYISTVKKLRTVTRGAQAFTKAVSGTYLEYTFGWKPLALDTLAAYRILTDHNKFVMARIKGAATHRFFGDTNEASYPGFGGFHNLFISYQRYGTYGEKLVGGVRIEPKVFPSNLERFGITLPDLIPTLYEVLPYSFVVDYFVNIGEVIDCYSHPLSNLTWVSKSARTLSATQFSDVFLREVGGVGSHAGKVDCWIAEQSGGSAQFLRKSLVRTVPLPSQLVPSLQLRLPEFSSKPWRNLIALIAQGL